jgi:D-glycero-alpha-D-manno-heptose 1-phosphate guanylyltransferase
MSHFGNKYRSTPLIYSHEENPLGTGGAIKQAFRHITGHRSFVFNGDTLFKVELVRMFDFHISRSAVFSLALRMVDDVSRYGAVERDEEFRITRFLEKGVKTGPGMINGGVYLINKEFFEKNKFPDVFSIEKDCLEKMVETFPFYGKVCRQYFIDIGIPEDYHKAQDDFKGFIG